MVYGGGGGDGNGVVDDDVLSDEERASLSEGMVTTSRLTTRGETYSGPEKGTSKLVGFLRKYQRSPA